MELSQLYCGGCRTLLMHARGATTVRCSCCNTINYVPGMIYTHTYTLWELPYNADVSSWSSLSQMCNLSLYYQCLCKCAL